jgi:hypothetical protein
MSTHLWNLLNKGQTYIKSRWCHLLWWMPLGNLKRKTYNIHMNEGQNKYLKNILGLHVAMHY